jgi:hypothetical protein
VDLVLHIGRHKTGTTAIQWHLADVPYAGVCYPVTGRVRADGRLQPGHHTLARSFADHDPDTEAPRIAMAMDIRDEAEGSDLVILSSEAFQSLDDSGLERLDRFLQALRPTSIRVICYLREYLEYLMSAYQQTVQEHPGTHDFIAYSTGLERLRLDSFLSRWERVGPTTVLLYDRDQFPERDIVMHFLQQVGIARRESGVRRLIASNPSVSGALLVVKAILNQVGFEPLPDYVSQTRLALSEPRFRGPFRVTDATASVLRSRTDYNGILATLHPNLMLRSFTELPAMPDLTTFDTDLDLIADELGFNGDQTTMIAERVGDATGWFRVE